MDDLINHVNKIREDIDAKPTGIIEGCDDGSHVELDSYSGGASLEGVFGKLSLAFVDTTVSRKVRECIALDLLSHIRMKNLRIDLSSSPNN